MTPEAPFELRVAAVGRLWSAVRIAAVALLLALGGPVTGGAQARPGALTTPDAAAFDSSVLTQAGPSDTIRQRSSETGSPHSQRKVTRQLGELEPVLEWQWGAILATLLAMTGAIVLTLPVALAYRWTKPAHEYDPGVMHSSIILAPTIAGILIVIQGSLAMAFSLAGVATAVRFRNSLKDTNDAVYIFVAVAIGLAAGGQALDIALAISTIFSVMVVLLSKSPFRNTGNSHHPGYSHHHSAHDHHDHRDPPMMDYITVRASQPEPAGRSVEAILDRAAKVWWIDRATRESNGGVTLVYAVRCRKRTPCDLLLAELRPMARQQGFTVEAAPGV